MNESYDIPSEPRLSNSLHLNRPTPQSRTKMKQKKRSPPLPPDLTPFLSLDDTVPLDDLRPEEFRHVYSSLPTELHSSGYINQSLASKPMNNDEFYVIPREENSIASGADTNPQSADDDTDSSNNPTDTNQFYAVPPNYSKNFVLQSNLSFDDSQDAASVSLDCVPDLSQTLSNTNGVYYSYPEQQIPSSREKLINSNEEKKMFLSTLNRVLQQQIHAQHSNIQSKTNDESNNYYSVEPADENSSEISPLIDDFSRSSINNQRIPEKTTDYLDIIRENISNGQCADCDCENPTIAIMSWLLIICRKCAVVHRSLTSQFLRLQSLLITDCDPDLVELLREYGNEFSNRLLEHQIPATMIKPTYHSSQLEREQYITKKYVDRQFLCRSPYSNKSQEELNEILYENVETSNCTKTLHLLMLGANPNYSPKMFTVADHARRHQQWRQMTLIVANGGLLEFDLMKNTNDERILVDYETNAHLVTKHGILKEFRTKYEGDRLKIHLPPSQNEKSSHENARYLFEIDLNNVLAICNQAANSISLKSRSAHLPTINVNSQCILIVDEPTSYNEYVWIFPSGLERALWIQELLKRQYPNQHLINPDFTLLTKLNVQEGINAEKQQAIASVYAGRLVICSDTIFDEIDLRKYSSLTYQKSDEFTGVILCLVSNRFIYLSSPISKLTDMLFTCLRQATKVKTLTDLNSQVLTSQNVPVIVERFINFIFEYGLESKGIYRQAGQESKIKQLLNEFLEDPFNNQLTRENYTEHDVASGLKRFLRQLETPLLGSRQKYDAWLRSTVDSTISTDQLIQYYRGLLADLKHNHPIQYATLRKMLLHIQTVSMLSDRNGMVLSNLVSTFAPCIISQNAPVTASIPTIEQRDGRVTFNDDSDCKGSRGAEDTLALCENDYQDSSQSLMNTRSPNKLQRNPSLQSAARLSMISTSSPSHFPLSSSYARVTPSIQADLEIMNNLCLYYRQLFDITDEEFEHEKKCVETLLSLRSNQCQPRKLSGTMVSVYFESRANESNGYAINILEQETTAAIVIDKLLNQILKHDCFFWALFEVIIDQNLERPMFSEENISTVLHRYRTYLPAELNRQATFVVKLNYVQFEKERLQQNNQELTNTECEYFDLTSKRWIPCLWIYEKSQLQIYRISQEKSLGWKSRFTSSTSNSLSRKESSLNSTNPNANDSPSTILFSWYTDELHLYIGADRRYVNPFDMNEYRTLTILHPDRTNEISFGIAFRFPDRFQMFAWYLEITRMTGHDQWTRKAARTIPNGVNYLPLQNYHTPSSTQTPTKKKSEQIKTKLMAKSSHVASTLGKKNKKIE